MPNVLQLVIVVTTLCLYSSKTLSQVGGHEGAIDRMGGIKAARAIDDTTKKEKLATAEGDLAEYLIALGVPGEEVKLRIDELRSELSDSKVNEFSQVESILDSFENLVTSKVGEKDQEQKRQTLNARLWDYLDLVNLNQPNAPTGIKIGARFSKVKASTELELEKGLRKLLSPDNADKDKEEKILMRQRALRARDLRILGVQGEIAVEELFAAKTDAEKRSAREKVLKMIGNKEKALRLQVMAEEDELKIYTSKEKKDLAALLRLSKLELQVTAGVEQDALSADELAAYKRSKLLDVLGEKEPTLESVRKLSRELISPDNSLKKLGEISKDFSNYRLKNVTDVLQMKDEELKKIAQEKRKPNEGINQFIPPILQSAIGKMGEPLRKLASEELEYRQSQEEKKKPAEAAFIPPPPLPPLEEAQETFQLKEGENRRVITRKDGDYELFRSVDAKGQSNTFLYKLEKGEKSYAEVFKANRFKPENLSLVGSDGREMGLNKASSSTGNYVFGKPDENAQRWTAASGVVKANLRVFNDQTFELVTTTNSVSGEIKYYTAPGASINSGFAVYPDGSVFEYQGPPGYATLRRVTKK